MDDMKIGTQYKIECVRQDGSISWTEDIHNICPLVGRQYILTAARGGTSYSSWYIGLFATNYTPLDSDTLATLLTAAPEFTSYSESTRVLFEPEALGSGSTLINSVTVAEFTLSAGATLYGAFMTNQPTKSNTTGVLMSAAKFSTARAGLTGEVLRVTAGMVLASA